MAATLAETQLRTSADFVESAVLEAVVPSKLDADIKDEFSSWVNASNDDHNSIVPSLSQRQILFFDELVSVYIVFRTPVVDETTLTSYLARLAVNVESFAFSTAPNPDSEGKAPPAKELLASEAIHEATAPIVIPYDGPAGTYTYVFWRTEVLINRPKHRFYQPAIYFHPTASLKPAEKVRKSAVEDDYLPSKVPTVLNLLQSFENDPALSGIKPRLSALRISKIAPTAPVARELVRPIRTGQRRLFRALPALVWRVRYSRIQRSASDVSLIASVDIEIAYVTGCRIIVRDVRLSLRGGQVKTLAGLQDATQTHKLGDQLTYLYKITPDLSTDGTPLLGVKGHILGLELHTTVLVSKDCCPEVVIKWQSAVDFLTEQQPNLIKAAHRLSNPTARSAKVPNPDALPLHDAVSQSEEDGSHKAIQLTLTVSGPCKVQVGEMFRWEIFIVNRSEGARKLAILAITKRKRDFERHKSHPSTSSAGGHRSDQKSLLAGAVVDENILYAKQKHAKIEAADLVCLTTDVRMGHLAPGACFTAELQLIALSAGVHSLDAVRVVDLASHETSDIRDLPAIVASETEA